MGVSVRDQLIYVGAQSLDDVEEAAQRKPAFCPKRTSSITNGSTAESPTGGPRNPLPDPACESYVGRVIWLQTPPWARWIAALLIAGLAVWIEVRPDPSMPHPFAIEDIPAGAVIDESNTEQRRVPVGTFEAVEIGGVAVESIGFDEPVLASDLGDPNGRVPEGWWMVEVALPSTARTGAAARLVMLDSGAAADGIVVSPAIDDPMGSGLGMIAVESEQAADVARAAKDGRLAVMIATG